MEVINESASEKILVEDAMPGVAFNWGGSVFMRIPTVEMMSLTTGEVFRNVVGINLENGCYFCDGQPGTTYVYPLVAKVVLN